MGQDLEMAGGDEVEATVLFWSQRKARVFTTLLASIVAAILVAHVFFLAEPHAGLLFIAFPLLIATLPWAGRALSPMEAVRITDEGVTDWTAGHRFITWSQIHDVHLKHGQLGLELVDAPPPTLYARFDRFVRVAKGDHFISASGLDIPARDLLEMIDDRLQRRLFDEAGGDHMQLHSAGDDI